MPDLRHLLLAVLTAAALALGACGDDDEDSGDSASTGTQSEPRPRRPRPPGGGGARGGAADQQGPLEEADDPAAAGDPPTELQKEDIVKGKGTTAKAGDNVTVQYVGVNHSNGAEFDASWNRGEPFTFTLGSGQVIPGWDEGVAGMKEGGRRKLVIPPDIGLRAAGLPAGRSGRTRRSCSSSTWRRSSAASSSAARAVCARTLLSRRCTDARSNARERESSTCHGSGRARAALGVLAACASLAGTAGAEERASREPTQCAGVTLTDAKGDHPVSRPAVRRASRPPQKHSDNFDIHRVFFRNADGQADGEHPGRQARQDEVPGLRRDRATGSTTRSARSCRFVRRGRTARTGSSSSATTRTASSSTARRPARPTRAPTASSRSSCPTTSRARRWARPYALTALHAAR